MKQLITIMLLSVVVSVFFTAVAWAIEADPINTQVKLNTQSIEFVRGDMGKLEKSLAAINTKLDLLTDRPSWMTAVVITFLSSVTIALLVNTVKRK